MKASSYERFSDAHAFIFGNATTGVDDIEVEIVPEPRTWALLLGRLAAMIFWPCRKKA